jgi:hypothetical protein
MKRRRLSESSKGTVGLPFINNDKQKNSYLKNSI